MIAAAVNNWSLEKALLILLLLIGVFGGVLAFTSSYFSNTNVLIGICLFPFALLITGPRRNNLWYITLTVLFVGLAVTYQVRIFYYFSIAFYFLWIFELFAGRLNFLIQLLIVFMSPFFIQVVTILGFPIRMMLSALSGALLHLVGVNVQVEGNMITLDGAMFSVDEACMGLNMLAISLLMGVFVLVFRYRVSGTTLGLYPTAIFFIVAFILNMVTNVIRIIVLVFFRIAPDNPMHEFIGILCLVVYVVIPLHFLGGWLVQKYGTPGKEGIPKPLFSRSHIVFMALIPFIVLVGGVTIGKGRHSSEPAHANVHFNGLEVQRLDDGISKVSTNDLLVYVKTIPEFFTGEHTPLMCWKGSGYAFSGVTTVDIAGVTVYKGSLVKDGKSLHTAWWYSNGKIQTISQLDWRMRMLKGEPKFCLVNATAEHEHTLMKSLNAMFTVNQLTIDY